MSWPALGWASKQRPGRVADKMVLIALADRHNEEADLSYPSIAWLAEFSCLDRKTVVAALARLEATGLIADSGQRVGKTKQVKAYRLALNSTEIGNPKTELLQDKSTTFPAKQYRKRDTEPFKEPVSSDATHPQNRSARRPEEIEADLWDEFRRVRKKALTPTALKGIEREAAKAGWTLTQAITKCIERGWQGFEAKWVKDEQNDRPGNHPPRRATDTRTAAALALERMGLGGGHHA